MAGNALDSSVDEAQAGVDVAADLVPRSPLAAGYLDTDRMAAVGIELRRGAIVVPRQRQAIGYPTALGVANETRFRRTEMPGEAKIGMENPDRLPVTGRQQLDGVPVPVTGQALPPLGRITEREGEFAAAGSDTLDIVERVALDAGLLRSIVESQPETGRGVRFAAVTIYTPAAEIHQLGGIAAHPRNECMAVGARHLGVGIGKARAGSGPFKLKERKDRHGVDDNGKTANQTRIPHVMSIGTSSAPL